MGLIIGFGLFAGVVIGLVVTAATGTLALVVTLRGARRRLYVWRVVRASAAILVGVLILLVQVFVNQPVNPGNDYDIIMQNLFIAGLGYSATPGVAALVGALVSYLCPRMSAADSGESNT